MVYFTSWFDFVLQQCNRKERAAWSVWQGLVAVTSHGVDHKADSTRWKQSQAILLRPPKTASLTGRCADPN